MKNTIKQLDYSKYYALANQIVPSLVSLNVFEESGKVIWTSNETNNPINRIAIRKGELEQNVSIARDKIYTAELKDKHTGYIKYMYSRSDELYGGVALVVDSSKRDSNIAKILLQLSSFISKEIELASELNAMSFELEERYEELNLVYESDDPIIESDNGPEILEKLISNCTDYLDVAMTALIMSREDLTVFNIKDSEKIHYVHSILTQFKSYSFPWIEKNGQSIVSNDLADGYRQDVFPDIPYKIVCSPIYVADNTVGGILVTLNPNSARDFTNSDRNLLEAMAKKASKIAMASYDGLTGLFKRNAYEGFLERALGICRTEAKTYCLLHIDIDGIKVVNETIGNKAGDYLISEIAKLLRENTRDTDIIARLMGDKFGILLDACPLETGCAIADSIRKAIQDAKFTWESQKFEATACIGVAELNADSENIQSAIAAAELSVGIAKENGRNIVQVYQQADTILQRRKGEVHWIREIQKALKLDRFELYCQPIVPISNASNTDRFEVLLRLFGDDGAMVSPDNFIPAAERFRLMTAIDEWVIEHTFALLSEYRSVVDEYMWSINLSGLSLGKQEIVQNIIELSKRFNISPGLICFEITETAALSNMEQSKKFINVLREKGFCFALDDFGTGTSTFTYLKNLPVDYLKIDGSFIKEIIDDQFAQAVVSSITQVSRVRNLLTIAEYVENKEILQCIKGIGVDFAQGYGVGKPASLKETLMSLSSGNSRVVND